MKKLVVLLLGLIPFLAVTAQVTITEVFYDTPLYEHMRTKIGVDLEGEHHNGEFVELYNNSTLPVDLSGFSLKTLYVAAYDSYVFPENTICKPKDYILVCFRHPNSPDFKLKDIFAGISAENEMKIFYHSSFVLGNKGNNVILRNKKFEIISSLNYNENDAFNGTKKHFSVHKIPSLSNTFISESFGKVIRTQANPFGLVDKERSLLKNALLANQPKISNVNRSVGEIKSNFSTSPSGAACVEVPLSFPAGITGLDPALAIAYNSQGGIGTLGIRTELSGLSEITRTQESKFFDNCTNPVKFQEGGPFSLDGTRLIRNKNITNRYETSPIHSYTEIEAIGNSGNGPLYFRVTSKEGIVTEYGSEKSGRVYANDGVNILTWKISKVTNLNGNSINYTYTTDPQKGSYIKEIQYMGSVPNKIQFNYVENQYLSSSSYIDGSFFSSGLLLSDIVIRTGSLVFEKYQFNYSSARLVQIIENGINGEMLSLDFVWGAEYVDKVIKTDLDLYAVENTPGTSLGDFDGDGVQEIVYPVEDDNSLNFYFADNSSRFDNTPKYKISLNSAGCQAKDLINIADIDSDGKEELIFLNKTKTGAKGDETHRYELKIFKLENGVLKLLRSYSHILTDNAQLFLVNIDNDEFTDFFLVSDNGCYALMAGINDNGGSRGKINDLNCKQTYPVPLDYDGDGYTDLLIRRGGAWLIYNIKENKITDNYLLSYNSRLTDATVADIDNNGLSDLILINGYESNMDFSSSHSLLRNSGNNSLSKLESPDISNFFNDLKYTLHLAKTNCIQSDISGDGLPDLCFVLYFDDNRYSDILEIGIYILFQTRGGGYYLGHSEIVDKDVKVTVADLNGDGIAEIVKLGKNKVSTISYPRYHDGKNKNLLYKVENNGVPKVLFSYKHSGKNYFNEPYIYNPAEKNRCNMPPALLVNEIMTPNGVSDLSSSNSPGFSSTRYKYYRGSYLNDGRGFLGFERIDEVEQSNGHETIRFAETRLDKTYFIPAVQITQNYINKKLTSTNTSECTISPVETGDGHPAAMHVAVSITKQSEVSYLQSSSVTKTMNYDAYHRLTKQTDNYEDGSYAITEYKGYSDHWQPLVITETRKHFDDNTPFVSETKYTYDARSNPTSITEFSNSTSPVTTFNAYYDNGLLLSKKTQAQGVEQSTEFYEYNPESGKHKVTRTTPVTITKSYYNLITGNLEEETVTPAKYNAPRTTRHYYDGLGTKFKTDYPDGTQWIKTYKWGSGGRSYFETTERVSGKVPVTKWFDVLGRNIYTSALDGDILTENAIIYDAAGQKVSEIDSHPYKTTWSNYSYYPEGRPKSVTSNIGKSVEYSYDERSIYTNVNGKEYIKTLDCWGNVLRQTDPDKTTVIHNYNSNGKPRATTVGSHTVTMTYDGKGNRLKLYDPDIGEISYTYDAYNRVKSYKDPKGSYTLTYDYYGRVLKKAYSTGRVYDYTYIESGNGTGLIQSIRANNGTGVSFIYDANGRVLTKKETTDSQTFIYSNTYDNLGRTTRHITPNGFILNYVYDNVDSRLLKVTDQSNNTLWEHINDIPGISNEYKIGNSLVCSSTNAEDESACSIQWRRGYGTLLLESSYVLDPLLGNITSRSEWYNSRRFTENFEYDDMDRLTRISGSTNMQLSFANSGNISQKSNVGTYLYESGRTHAVTGIDNPAEALKSKPSQVITYTEFNKIETIKEGVYEMNFVYGPDEQRVKSELYQNKVLIRTIYYGEGFEKHIDKDGVVKEHSYLDTDEGTFGMAIKTLSTGVTSMYYFHNDLQGSLIAISNASGMILERHSYDAWGRKRSPTSWNIYTNVPASNLTLRGYTFQEEMPEFGLVNLNGRLYDPFLGRMLSPDPYVQEPDMTQSYNRYSYCLNNPLKYTDTNGEFWNLIIGAAIGGFVNWATHGFKFNKEGLKYFGVGALAGALSGGIGTGVTAAFTQGVSFGAGFLGTSAAMSTIGSSFTSSFVSGLAIGSSSGFAGGFISGFGNGLVDGKSFKSALGSGLKDGLIGGAIGGAVAGLAGGINARSDGRNFWHGGRLTEDVSMNLTQVYQGYGTDDCRYMVGKSFDEYYNGSSQNIEYLRLKYPNIQTDVEQLTSMYNERMIGFNEINDIKEKGELAKDISDFLKQDKGVSYEMKVLKGTQAHATAITRVRIYDNGKIIINLMDPERGNRILRSFKNLNRLFWIQKIGITK